MVQAAAILRALSRFFAGDHGCGRLAVGDLLAQVRSGNRGEAVGRQVERFHNDFIHALAGGAFDAFHQRGDECGFGNQVLEFDERDAGELCGDGHDHNVGVGYGFGTVAGGGHVAWQHFHAGQANTVVMVVANVFHNLRFDGPHSHIVACIGKHLTESGSPSSCAQYRHVRHICSLHYSGHHS